jgi:hypothetical protein
MAINVKLSYPSLGIDPALPNSNTEFNQNPLHIVAVKHTNWKTMSHIFVFISQYSITEHAHMHARARARTHTRTHTHT